MYRRNGQRARMLKRGRLAGADYEPVNRVKVFERDNWRCGICRRKINPKLVHPHPRSATVDHIVPISKGGEHTYRNTQAAHWECNSIKSDGGSGEQLRLI